jgi:hypothetical protein
VVRILGSTSGNPKVAANQSKPLSALFFSFVSKIAALCHILRDSGLVPKPKLAVSSDSSVNESEDSQKITPD